MQDKKVTISPLAVGIARAIVGVAGAVIAIALSDKNNRKKVVNVWHDAKDWSDKRMKEMKATTSKSDEHITEELDKLEDEATEALDKSKKVDDIADRERPQVIK